jgi:hypothetical protein
VASGDDLEFYGAAGGLVLESGEAEKNTRALKHLDAGTERPAVPPATPKNARWAVLKRPLQRKSGHR